RDPDHTRAILARRGDDAGEAFNAAVVADEHWRLLTARVEELRAERKQRPSTRRGRPSPEEVEAARALGDTIGHLETERKQKEAERPAALWWVPNRPDDSVPRGVDETENELLRVWGEPCRFDFDPLPHDELAKRLGILDMEAGATLAGARFYVLKGAGA